MRLELFPAIIAFATRRQSQVLFLILLGLFSACTRVVDPNLEAPPVLAEPLSLRVGVYYADALRNHELTNQPPVEVSFTVKTGAAHVSYFNGLFSELFVETVSVASKDAAFRGDQAFDALIEPTIVSLDYFFYDDGGFNMIVPVEAQYEIHLYGSDGEPVHSWIVSGEGETDAALAYTAIEDGVAIALREAAAQFTLELLDDDALPVCLASLNGDPPSADELKSCFAAP